MQDDTISKNDRFLTQAEENIMFVLWKINKGSVKEILPFFAEPSPAYTTVSTLLRILEDKNFVSHEKEGKSHIYYPLISKKKYTSLLINHIVENYFNSSDRKLAIFMLKSVKLDSKEIKKIKKTLKKQEK